MKFSIILPVKNGGKYIKECVASILSQTYTDFNLHILENKSTDGTAEWLQTLYDERIIIIPSEKSLRIEENWARILLIDKNESMTIIGHDDLLDKDYLQTMNELISQHPDASLYQTHFRFIDAKGNVLRHCKPMVEKQSNAEFLQSLFTNSIDTMGTGYMMHSKDYNAVGGIPLYPNLLFADHSLWIQLTALHYKATTVEERFSYRLHENLSKNSDAESYILAFYNYMDFLVSIKEKYTGLSATIEKYITQYIEYYCRSLAHRLIKLSVVLKQTNVAIFIERCVEYNALLSNNSVPLQTKKFNIQIAKVIDEHKVLRDSFLLFKKIFKKPVYK